MPASSFQDHAEAADETPDEVLHALDFVRLGRLAPPTMIDSVRRRSKALKKMVDVLGRFGCDHAAEPHVARAADQAGLRRAARRSGAPGRRAVARRRFDRDFEVVRPTRYVPLSQTTRIPSDVAMREASWRCRSPSASRERQARWFRRPACWIRWR